MEYMDMNDIQINLDRLDYTVSEKIAELEQEIRELKKRIEKMEIRSR